MNPQICTCKGSCLGSASLGEGWICALETPRIARVKVGTFITREQAWLAVGVIARTGEDLTVEDAERLEASAREIRQRINNRDEFEESKSLPTCPKCYGVGDVRAGGYIYMCSQCNGKGVIQ